jgi:hypothetical protein
MTTKLTSGPALSRCSLEKRAIHVMTTRRNGESASTVNERRCPATIASARLRRSIVALKN